MKKNKYFYIGLILAIIGFILLAFSFFGGMFVGIILTLPGIFLILVGLLFLIYSVIKKGKT